MSFQGALAVVFVVMVVAMIGHLLVRGITGGEQVARQFRGEELDHHLPVERHFGGQEDATHAAAAELAHEAGELRRLLARFDLGGNEGEISQAERAMKMAGKPQKAAALGLETKKDELLSLS